MSVHDISKISSAPIPGSPLVEAVRAGADAQYQEAVKLHLHIKSQLEATATALMETCRGLKEMRDSQRYKALGHERFESYTEEMLGIKERQAYYYISTYENLGAEVIEENAALGITKLRLLAEVTPLDRADFLEDNDLAGMSTAEIREAVKERNGLREQLSMYQNADGGESGTDERSAWLEHQLAAEKEARAKAEEELEERLEEEKKAALEEARATFAKEREKELSAAREAGAEEGMAAAAADLQKKIDKAKKDAVKEAQAAAKAEQEAAMAVERAEKDAALERAAAAEKQLKIAASTESTRFMLLFEQMGATFEAMLAQTAALADQGSVDGAAKLEKALHRALGDWQSRLEYAAS